MLPSKFRIAFFKPVGASASTFDADASRKGSAIEAPVPFRKVLRATCFPVMRFMALLSLAMPAFGQLDRLAR